MKINLYPKILFRVPQFSIDTQLVDCWHALKESIRISSPEFFQIIKDLSAEQIGEQSIAVQVTIFKYFNRARFRATPYGTFAMWGLCRHDSVVTPMIVSSNFQKNCFSDWSETKGTSESWKLIPIDQLLFQANSTWYKVGGSIRYVYAEGNAFELSDIIYCPVVENILVFCSEANSFVQLQEKLKLLGLTQMMLKDLLHDLIVAKLIITDLHPNIIGKDYFSRIDHELKMKHNEYIMTRVPLISGCFNHPAVRDLSKLIHLLQSIWKLPESSDLQDFIGRFERKYDKQAIPIMSALDPEIGIGYSGLESSLGTSGLIEDILASKSSRAKDQSTIQKFFHAALCRGTELNLIRLEDLRLDNVAGTDLLPNTFSALISATEDKIIVEQLGGATANALLGRFTLGSEELLAGCRDLSKIEQEANPEVLFFDVGYMGEVAVDNVNRREQIYPYSLTILNYDISAEPLSLTDLYLSVVGGELMLFSKKMGKRLIPRISTAYNYIRSDLSLFRLLCDLQYQGIPAVLLPNLEEAVPDLKYYPRLVYRNIILSAAKWKLEYQDKFQDLAFFSDYLHGIGLPNCIKVGFADQTLVINLHDQFEVYVLSTILKKNKALWAKEAFVPSKCLVADENGNGYASEFVLTFVHSMEGYKGIPFSHPIKDIFIRRSFEPGSEWLYYQIFIHPDRASELLTVLYKSIVMPYERILLSWFFIRYNDGGEHIRFRLRLKDIKYLGQLMELICLQLSGYISSGIVSDVKICTYDRELERYGKGEIEQVEAHFHIDSIYGMSCLQQGYGAEELYWLTTSLMMQTANEVFSADEVEQLINNWSRMHNEEHLMTGAMFKRLNREFKGLQNRSWTGIPAELSEQYFVLLASFVETLKQQPGNSQEQTFADLFHMHINRLFPYHQRIHEMIIYNYLAKINRLLKTSQKIAITDWAARD
ncbi:hypothetical protein D3C71_89410 [compost metagenome]